MKIDQKDVFKILDHALFYDGREVETDLMRHLYRLQAEDQIDDDPRELFNAWMAARGHTIRHIEVVYV